MVDAAEISTKGRSALSRDVYALVLAGIVAEIAFEAIAWGLIPLLFGFALQPAFLVNTLFTSYLGMPLGYPMAFMIHVVAGAILFPLGYWLFLAFRPIDRPWLMGGLWGLLLWCVAQGVLAPLAGRPFMMGWGTYTWGSLIAHLLYAFVLAHAYRWNKRLLAG